MKWYENWIEVFKSGTHTSSSGDTRTWSNDDLDAIVANYDPSVDEAPVVLGHPKTDEPAYAWVSALRREGDVLLAKFERVCPEFAIWVEKGLYRKISIALGPDFSLRHVGFLGAANPAVKGLSNDFSADKGFCYTSENEFDYRLQMPWDSLVLARKNSSFGSLFSKSGAGSFAAHPRNFAPVKLASQSFTSPTSSKIAKSSSLSSFLQPRKYKENTMFKKQSAAEFSARIEELERELEFAQKENITREFGEFLDGLHAQAKITAEDKTTLGRVFSALAEVESAEFCVARENDIPLNQSSLEEFSEFLNALPKRCEFSELATRANAPKGTYRTPQEELGMKIAKSI